MKSKLLGVMAIMGSLSLFPSAGHALSFDFSFTGGCNVAGSPCTVTGEIDGLAASGSSAATAVIIDTISSPAFTLPSPLPFNTFCGTDCSIGPNTFTVTGGLITAEDFVATNSVAADTTTAPFLGLWNLSLGAADPGIMTFSNGTTVNDCGQPCADYQDNIYSDQDFTFTPIKGGTTPLPAALPLFATGLGTIGLIARRKRRKSAFDPDAEVTPLPFPLITYRDRRYAVQPEPQW